MITNQHFSIDHWFPCRNDTVEELDESGKWKQVLTIWLREDISSTEKLIGDGRHRIVRRSPSSLAIYGNPVLSWKVIVRDKNNDGAHTDWFRSIKEVARFIAGVEDHLVVTVIGPDNNEVE